MRSVTVVCEQIFEFLVRALRALVDADIGKLSSLEARFEVLKRPGIVREFEPSPVGKIPCHVVLRLVVGSELREELVRVGYERLKVILLVTEDSGMEVGVLDVLQDLHERTKALASAAAASHDFYVGIDCKHALLSTPLCDDFQLVGVFFVSIAKILDVLLRVDRLSRREE